MRVRVLLAIVIASSCLAGVDAANKRAEGWAEWFSHLPGRIWRALPGSEFVSGTLRSLWTGQLWSLYSTSSGHVAGAFISVSDSQRGSGDFSTLIVYRGFDRIEYGSGGQQLSRATLEEPSFTHVTLTTDNCLKIHERVGKTISLCKGRFDEDNSPSFGYQTVTEMACSGRDFMFARTRKGDHHEFYFFAKANTWERFTDAHTPKQIVAHITALNNCQQPWAVQPAQQQTPAAAAAAPTSSEPAKRKRRNSPNSSSSLLPSIMIAFGAICFTIAAV
ncbi:Uncharacterized protein PBTT_10372 [Plasmodiophora brassicae]